jgi:hypothetical protein
MRSGILNGSLKNNMSIFSAGASTIEYPRPMSILNATSLRNNENILTPIIDFVDSQGSGFSNILRINQTNLRYIIKGFTLTKPKKKEGGAYEWGNVIGIIYKDTKPETDSKSGKKIRYKQDFVLCNEDMTDFRFVIGSSWFSFFPELSTYGSLIWDWKTFNKEIANGQHYYDKEKGNFNHRYYYAKDLPKSIKSMR